MNLDAPKALIHHSVHRAGQILQLRMDGGKGNNATGGLGAGVQYEAVDALHIVGRQRHGMGGEAGDTGLVHLAQAIPQGAVAVHADAVIKHTNAVGSLFRNLVRIDVYMDIKNLHKYKNLPQGN